MREETGWAVEIIRPLQDVRYSFCQEGLMIDKTVRFFFMRPLRREDNFQADEVIDIRWCSLEDARRVAVYESDKTLLMSLADEAAHGRL